jgi:hypothetical protein
MQYDIHMTLFQGTHARASGLTAALKVDTGRTRWTSEVAYPPFGLLLLIDSVPDQRVGGISYFAEFGYDEKKEICLEVFVGEVHTPFPADYRGWEQIRKDAATDAKGE